MRKAITVSLVVAALALATTRAEARDLTYEDILGKWCGEGLTYTISRDRLTVTFRSGDEPPRRNTITDFAFDSDTVTINWLDSRNKNERVHTKFTEFSSDGRFMTQVSVRTRHFRRC